MMLSVFINTINWILPGDRLNYLLLTLLQINSQRAYSNPNMYIGVMFRHSEGRGIIISLFMDVCFLVCLSLCVGFRDGVIKSIWATRGKGQPSLQLRLSLLP